MQLKIDVVALKEEEEIEILRKRIMAQELEELEKLNKHLLYLKIMDVINLRDKDHQVLSIIKPVLPSTVASVGGKYSTFSEDTSKFKSLESFLNYDDISKKKKSARYGGTYVDGTSWCRDIRYRMNILVDGKSRHVFAYIAIQVVDPWGDFIESTVEISLSSRS